MKQYQKRLILYSILLIISTILLYIVGSITGASLDITEWPKDIREPIGSFFGVLNIVAIVTAFIIDSDYLDTLTK